MSRLPRYYYQAYAVTIPFAILGGVMATKGIASGSFYGYMVVAVMVAPLISVLSVSMLEYWLPPKEQK